MLVIAYHLLAQGTYYDEQRYAEQQPQRAERERKRAINALERLGYTVTVQRVASLQGLRADRVSVSPPAVGRVRETSIQLARVSCAFSESGISWEPQQIDHGGFESGVAEVELDEAEVNAGFEQMGGVRRFPKKNILTS